MVQKTYSSVFAQHHLNLFIYFLHSITSTNSLEITIKVLNYCLNLTLINMQIIALSLNDVWEVGLNHWLIHLLILINLDLGRVIFDEVIPFPFIIGHFNNLLVKFSFCTVWA